MLAAGTAFKLPKQLHFVLLFFSLLSILFSRTRMRQFNVNMWTAYFDGSVDDVDRLSTESEMPRNCAAAAVSIYFYFSFFFATSCRVCVDLFFGTFVIIIIIIILTMCAIKPSYIFSIFIMRARKPM